MQTPALTLATSILIAAALPAQWSGEWKFDETSGTTAADISPSKHDGTLINFSGTYWGPGKFKGALTFDGVDDHVDLKTGPGLPVYKGNGHPYSICFWVKAPPQNDKRVYSESSTASNSPIVTFGSGRNSNQTTDKFQIYVRNDTGGVVLNGYSTMTVFDNTWHHVAWVDASGQTALYIDGKLDRTINYSRPPGSANFGTWTTDIATAGGIRRGGLCCLLTGSIDDLRVYNFALTPADIVLVVQHIPLIPRSGSIGFWGEGCNGALSIWGSGMVAPGGTVNMSLSRGTAAAAAQLIIGAQISAFDLGAIGFPGCTAYPSLQSSAFIAIGVTDAAGTVSPIKLPIPNLPALAGLLAGVQGFTIKNGVLQMSKTALLHIGG